MESEIEKLKAEIKRLEGKVESLQAELDLTLRGYYAEKEKEFKDEVLPTFEELVRTSTGPIDFRPSTKRPPQA